MQTEFSDEDFLFKRKNKTVVKTVLKKMKKPKFQRVKFLFVGDSGTGKSGICRRYFANKFLTKNGPTVGIKSWKKIDNKVKKELRVHAWDLSGMEKFFEVRNEFYPDCDIAVFVYSVDDVSTFDRISEKWMLEANRFGCNPDTKLGVLIGNKIDLVSREGDVVEEQDEEKTKNEVTKEMGQEFADKFNMLFFEVSALKDRGIKECFEKILKVYYKKKK